MSYSISSYTEDSFTFAACHGNRKDDPDGGGDDDDDDCGDDDCDDNDDDGEAHLEWGGLRADSQEGSTPNEVPADGKWFAWHLILELWFTVFSISATTLHILGLVGGLGWPNT